ncbi:OLC1v1028171C1 [Oldenlandia corymbosa var. corymbosa]|uniref:OLC1v1028171C1 n=1 Tax=Oldenlandia corymbosa var. corymbosa TaxID=529605 RepID=A0AAV1CB35_OLDCO|nr:OLC1v1028171C1 [Oldenlandia corymbosa var. corymbosa]
MGSTSALSLCSPSMVNRLDHEQNKGLKGRVLSRSLSYGAQGALLPLTPLYISSSSRRSRSVRLRIRAAASDGVSRRPSSGSRRVYRESQAQGPPAPVKELASSIAPVGAFVVVTFVLWKLVEKILVPKPAKSPSEEKRSTEGVKWSFAPGTNLLSPFTAKAERESRQRLNEFAKELRLFQSVDMSGRGFGNEGLYFLAESLAYNQTAEEVNFAANGITAEGIKAFDGVLQSNVALKTLDLSGNSIGDEGAKILSEILMGNSSIQKLQLNSTGLGDEGAKAIAELLKKNANLLVLELNNNLIDYSGFSGIAEALLENKSVEALYLNGNYGGALGASALGKGLEGNKSLRNLFLSGNTIGNEGVRALMAGLSARKGGITNLDISNNSITATGAFHVAEYIKRSKSLRWINMYMNDIKDEGAEKIAEALKQNRSVTVIDLGGNDIHAKGVTAIAQVLKDNSVLTTLEIGYNPIGPEGAKALAEVLKFHGSINNLMLGWCQIGVEGTEYIADMLKYNNTIASLDLRCNGLRDEGASCIARSLKVVNEALTTLNLGFNEIRVWNRFLWQLLDVFLFPASFFILSFSPQDNGAFAIAQALKANEDVRLTSLNLASNFLTKLGQTALTDARDHVFEMNEKEVAIFF